MYGILDSPKKKEAINMKELKDFELEKVSGGTVHPNPTDPKPEPPTPPTLVTKDYENEKLIKPIKP